jgi:dihydroxy-acid dehydratase
MHQFDKSKLPSRHVSVGPERAPHRSYYYAMGLTAEEIARPFVGVVSAGNDSAPCNTTLDAQADVARRGVEAGGGMPRRFNTITVTDGIAMGHQGMKSSLVSREVIADSVELSVRGHCYDALVGFAGCDKSLPGMMMAMLRLNVPSIFVYGGSILPGRFNDRDVTVKDVFEIVGKYAAGACPLSEVEALEKVACPGHGACGGQYTANTMACVGEAIGLSLPNSNMVPAPYTSREQIAHAAGVQVMALLAQNIRPRAFVPARRLKMPPALWRRPAGRPMRRCICRLWQTKRGLNSTCSTLPKFSNQRRISPTCNRAGSSLRATCMMPAASIC